MACKVASSVTGVQGQTDNSWGPRAIGDHGAPVFLPKLKKAYEKGTRGISWGPLLTPSFQMCPSFQMVSPPLLGYVYVRAK
ncbi:unnamed protein product [Staurois parvus]|uniref:Uncharacterized protein n=1 Tax=Staurois parvus TaxID=386267 RepID=A0ABN9HQ22_9NEOB|nr:unnamed protein product [Staurois parvus]